MGTAHLEMCHTEEGKEEYGKKVRRRRSRWRRR